MVHIFSIHGLNLALDVESGALHVLDNAAFLAVGLLAAGSTHWEVEARLVSCFGKGAEGVLKEIECLRAEGLLFCEPRHIKPDFDGVVKALCLHLAHDCNLRCRYCFAGSGNYGGERRLMAEQTAFSAVDFLITGSGRRRHIEIDFFGGEPLLNFGVLKETVAYGKARAAASGKVIKFTLTTNALKLDEEINRFLNSEGISVVLSLDGRPEVHDRMRRRPGGEGSYQAVADNCRRLVNSREGENYYLRGTYTRHNLDFTKDVAAMLDEGFFNISLEPAVLAPHNEDALSAGDLPVIFAEYEKLASFLWEKEKNGSAVRFFHFELDLDKGPCAKKRMQGCGAGTAYLAVAPDGSLFPCHQFVGEEKFRAGSVHDGPDYGKLLPFTEAEINVKDACALCFARYYCGGGCHASAWMTNGTLLEPYALGCSLHRKRVECGLFLQAKRILDKMAGD